MLTSLLVGLLPLTVPIPDSYSSPFDCVGPGNIGSHDTGGGSGSGPAGSGNIGCNYTGIADTVAAAADSTLCCLAVVDSIPCVAVDSIPYIADSILYAVAAVASIPYHPVVVVVHVLVVVVVVDVVVHVLVVVVDVVVVVHVLVVVDVVAVVHVLVVVDVVVHVLVVVLVVIPDATPVAVCSDTPAALLRLFAAAVVVAVVGVAVQGLEPGVVGQEEESRYRPLDTDIVSYNSAKATNKALYLLGY